MNKILTNKKNRLIAVAASTAVVLGIGTAGAIGAFAEEDPNPTTTATAPADSSEGETSTTDSTQKRGSRRNRTPINAAAATVTPAQAAETATAQVSGSQVYSITLRNSADGVLVYSVSVSNGDQSHKVTINAASGEVLSVNERTTHSRGLGRNRNRRGSNRSTNNVSANA